MSDEKLWAGRKKIKKTVKRVPKFGTVIIYKQQGRVINRHNNGYVREFY